MRQLVLASSSRYRKALLARLGVPFETAAPDIDETPRAGESPQALVERLSIAKARAVAPRYPDALVIGSDQVAVHGSDIVGKPGTLENARAQLRAAAGRRVTLYTGLALLDARDGDVQYALVPYSVHLRALTPQQIDNYLIKDQPFDCAGSVRAEGLGIAVIERFEGDDPNALIGLPLVQLTRMLEQRGLSLI